jgi:WD40 repeat protein
MEVQTANDSYSFCRKTVLVNLHTNQINSLEIAGDDKNDPIVYSCSCEQLNVYNLNSKSKTTLYSTSNPNAEELSYVKLLDSSRLALANENYIQIFDLNACKQASKYKWMRETINCIEKQGNLLACCDDSGSIKLIDMRTSASASDLTLMVKASLPGHSNVCYALKFNECKENELFSGGYDCSIIKWDLRSTKANAKTPYANKINVSEVLSSLGGDTSSSTFFNTMTPNFVHALNFAQMDTKSSESKFILMAGIENGLCILFEPNTCSYINHEQLQRFNCALTQISGKIKVIGSDDSMIACGGNGSYIELASLSADSGENAVRLNKSPQFLLNHLNKVNCLRSYSNKLYVADTSNHLSIYDFNM